MWKVPSKPIECTKIREGILAIFLITVIKYLSKISLWKEGSWFEGQIVHPNRETMMVGV